ncbi:MAG: RluA family pseudouridine synthase [bacterium]
MNIPLDIIYEDEDIIVLNKQAGISVHPSINEPQGTLANALIAKYPEIKNVGDDPIRPGIVHRLDKDTSGILVVAKNQKTFEFLKKQWQEGEVIKKYLALIWGHPKEKGEIVSELTRSIKDFRKRMVVRPVRSRARASAPEGPSGRATSNGVKGKLAITEYKVIKKFRDFSLVEVSPKTGRTHQIRVHMASLGHSIVGDKVYGKKKETPEGLARQFLHAYYLSFALPGGKKLALEADLPKDLEMILTKLEK